MIEYRFALPEDLPQITDFINMVFSMHVRPHDFEVLLPKVYDPRYNKSRIHAIALEGNRIIGCVGVYDFPIRVADETLKIGYLGSVSVHQKFRKQGIMKKLMQMQIERARLEGMDLLALGGQRQRYEYYGFTPCGCTCSYTVTARNIRHAMADVDASEYSFRKLAADDPAIERLFDLYDQQTVSGARTLENFYATLCSYHNLPWVILRKDEPAGYLIASENEEKIVELVMDEPSAFRAIVKGFLQEQKKSGVEILAAPFDLALNRSLAPVCEKYGAIVSNNRMMRCMNPERVIGAFMKLKQTCCQLSDGVLCLGIADMATIRIEVRNGCVIIEKTGEQPDLTLSLMEAEQLIFNYNRYAVAELPLRVHRDWFPLPFYIPEPDTF